MYFIVEYDIKKEEVKLTLEWKKSLNFLIGQVMRKMNGKADARQIQKVFEQSK